MRPYDRTNHADSTWQAAVSARARKFIPDFLSKQPDSCAATRDIRNRFKQENLGLCDDTIVRSVSNPQPKWEHCVASALSNLKVRGALISPDRGMWCLASVVKDESDTSPEGPKIDNENSERDNKFPGNPNLSSGEDAENILNENLQSEVSNLKSQVASQQSAIANLNAKIDSLSAVRPEEDTEDDVVGYLRERVLRLEPSEFERLVGEYLKSKGFSSVVVTGRSHDGGIDGECELPLIDVKVAFQAKRYAAGNNIGIDPVQRLNGSLGNSYDRGVFITTSEFTSFARGWVEEEQVKIALVDGDELVSQMIDMGLGVKTIPVVKQEVDESFFADLEKRMMTTTTEQDTTNERLARLEANQEALLRDTGGIKQDGRDLRNKVDELMLESQRNFRWIVGLQVTMLALLVIGLFLR